MESTAPKENPNGGTSAHALERAKEALERQIERAVADYEHAHEDEPLEVSLNFDEEDLPEGEDNEADEELMSQIVELVEDFHRSPAVSGKGVRVLRLTAIDSDADGEVAVRVHYDYAGYE